METHRPQTPRASVDDMDRLHAGARDGLGGAVYFVGTPAVEGIGILSRVVAYDGCVDGVACGEVRGDAGLAAGIL